MSRHFLITAFPSTPESCRQALALPSTTRTRRIRLRVCLSLLLCAVLLGGIACAASGYGVFRFLIEFVRMPDAQLGYLFGPITMGQMLSLPLVILGISLVIVAHKRNSAQRLHVEP